MGNVFGKKTKIPEINQNEQFAGEYIVRDGRRVASRVWDPKLNAYTSQIDTSPEEQQIAKQANAGISGILGRVSAMTDPSATQKYVDAYRDPQVRALNLSYDKAKGDLNNNASASGMSDSAGFGDFLVNQIEKNRAQGLADIEANSTLYGLDVPNKMLAPQMNLYNLFNGALTGVNANAMDTLDPALQGSSSATNAMLSGTQLVQNRAMNQAALKKSSGGIIGRLLGF